MRYDWVKRGRKLQVMFNQSGMRDEACEPMGEREIVKNRDDDQRKLVAARTVKVLVVFE
jgi:hypothetical protein